MKLLFLDIDGVLNSYGEDFHGICNNRCKLLDKILIKYPDLYIVISSSWLSFIRTDCMTLEGFEVMLWAGGLTHCRGRVVACLDQRVHGYRRAEAIKEYVQTLSGTRTINKWVALDDMDLEELGLPFANFVHVKGSGGITEKHILELERRLSE